MLKVATCDLVLRMIEEGVVMRDLTMENPIRAIREISHDMTGRRKVRLANGREASALDIQPEYLTKARDFVDRREICAPRSSTGPSTCGSAGSRRSSPTTSAWSSARSTGSSSGSSSSATAPSTACRWATRGSPSSTSPTTTSTAVAGSTTCWRSGARSPGSPTT